MPAYSCRSHFALPNPALLRGAGRVQYRAALRACPDNLRKAAAAKGAEFLSSIFCNLGSECELVDVPVDLRPQHRWVGIVQVRRRGRHRGWKLARASAHPAPLPMVLRASSGLGSIRFNQLGDSRALHMEDLPERQPRPGKVLLKVKPWALTGPRTCTTSASIWKKGTCLPASDTRRFHSHRQALQRHSALFDEPVPGAFRRDRCSRLRYQYSIQSRTPPVCCTENLDADI